MGRCWTLLRDRGFGPGLFSPRRERPPIVAADFCPPMLAIGRAKSRRAGAERRLTFRRRRCPAIAVSRLIIFRSSRSPSGCGTWRTPNAGLREMVRVCRPGRAGGGAGVFLADAAAAAGGSISFIFAACSPGSAGYFARNGSAAYNYLPASVGEFPSGERLADACRPPDWSKWSSRR